MIPTQGMWQMLSEMLDGEKLPESLNQAIYALCDGKATIVYIDNLKDKQ